ncbi:MAG: histidinol-phosphatase HisJ family protein [Massiliimalia sp.]
MNSITSDYHIHSKLSPDASCSMVDLCKAAAEKGLTEIVITDHFEFYTQNVQEIIRSEKVYYYPFSEDYLDQYFAELEQCQNAVKGQITVLSGAEMGQPYVNPEYAKKIMSRYCWDFIIGSVHKINDIDLGQMDYPNIPVKQLVKTNLEYLYQLADQGDFDVLGHIDLIKRYAARKGVSVHLRDYPDELNQIFRRLVERGKGIEINTSGLRQEAAEALPSVEVLKLYRQAGGEIVTVGSDAHILDHLGKDFSVVEDMLTQAGFSYLTHYRSRVPQFIPLGR